MLININIININIYFNIIRLINMHIKGTDLFLLIVLKQKILHLLTGVTLYLRKGGSPNPNGIPNRIDNLVFKHGARSLWPKNVCKNVFFNFINDSFHFDCLERKIKLCTTRR